MRKRFVKRRYYIKSIDYRLDEKFQAKREKILERAKRAVCGHPSLSDEFPPEYPFGLDEEGDECWACGCDCGGHDEDDEL